MRWYALFLAVFLASAVEADEAAVQRFKDYLPEEILAMSEDKRDSSVPLKFIMAANLATSEAGDLIIQANLNTLMYNGIGDYENAMKAFQNDLGEEPTGDLTVWQIHTLGYRSSRFNMTYVSFFPFDFGGAIGDDWAYVKGTVKILDERIAFPINHVDIECSRTEGRCEYRQTILTLPDESSWAQSYSVLELANDIYRITRWENDQIDAVPLNNAACRITQLSFNFATNEFFEIARNNTEGDCETQLGVTLPRLGKPRISQIVDGQEIVDAEFKRISDEGYGFLSSEFRNKIEAISAE